MSIYTPVRRPTAIRSPYLARSSPAQVPFPGPSLPSRESPRWPSPPPLSVWLTLAWPVLPPRSPLPPLILRSLWPKKSSGTKVVGSWFEIQRMKKNMREMLLCRQKVNSTRVGGHMRLLRCTVNSLRTMCMRRYKTLQANVSTTRSMVRTVGAEVFGFFE